MKKIGVIDYGVGNIGSIFNMLRRAGIENRAVTKSEELETCRSYILPGVGSFDFGMEMLHSSGLIEGLSDEVNTRRKPILGICLGAQLLTRGSEEGEKPGLGWVNGSTRQLRVNEDYKLPHMGWNALVDVDDSGLLKVNRRPLKFYFVHKYYLEMDSSVDCIAWVEYGMKFCAAYQCHNIFGVQFHPEKSHSYGLNLLRNFAGESGI